MDRNQILSRRRIEGLIAAGRTIVISEGRVLQLDGWLNKHPGGRLSMLHMVGRDATDEINAYHSSTALKLMSKYRIGRIFGQWENFTPPIRGGIYRDDIGQTDAVSDDSDDTTKDWSSNPESRNSSTTSLDSNHSIEVTQPDLVSSRTIQSLLQLSSAIETTHRRKNRNEVTARTCQQLADGSADFPLTSPEQYTSSTIQKEIDEDIRHSPSLDIETQSMITAKYQILHQRVKDEGFYDCNYSEYGKEITRYSVLFLLFVICLRAKWFLTSATFLGLFWQQIMFTAHDAGHRGITHNFVADTLIGIFIADFTSGLSIGWWKSSHNVHHLVTNHPEHDPDIQNVPLFATGPSFFRSIHSSYYNGFVFPFDAFANFMIKYQQYTYYPIMTLARFNLYVLSWQHLLSPRSTNLGSAAWTRAVEIAGMLCYWFLFGYCLLWLSIPTCKLRIAFVLVSHIVTLPLHIQITLSHWAMPTTYLGESESFPQRQLRTTMDIDCPPWLDFIHGGLQFQVVHHLFPRVPRHNLRRLQVLVKDFCAETGIGYNIFGLVEGNKKVLGRLGEVARQVEILVKCQMYMAQTGESGLY